MISQLTRDWGLGGVKAIVLGSFTDCRDSAPQVYAAAPRGKKKPAMKPLRKTLSEKEALRAIFGEIGETLGVPVFAGLPVGHGDAPGTIELGREYSLDASGKLRSR
jgi:muramoyltetrapeptide carboxypeptidase LdcA involved in peptidoglycan recycling